MHVYGHFSFFLLQIMVYNCSRYGHVCCCVCVLCTSRLDVHLIVHFKYPQYTSALHLPSSAAGLLSFGAGNPVESFNIQHLSYRCQEHHAFALCDVFTHNLGDQQYFLFVPLDL